MKPTKLNLSLLLLVTAAAIFMVSRQFSKPAVNFRPSTALGEVLADEVARLLGAAGKVVVISRAPAKEGTDAKGEQRAAFEAALKRRGSPKLAGTEWLPRPQPGTMDLGEVSTDQLLQFMEKNPDANAFVILAGLPPLSDALAAKITGRSLKLLAVCGYGGNVRRWLESRALAVAVVPRFDAPPAGAPAPKTAMDWVQREFQLLTPDTLSAIPN